MIASGRRSKFLQSCNLEMHISEWGDRRNPALILVHGLARTGRDFDELADALSDRFFILCPDIIGRGLSQWSPEPARDYSFATYAAMIGDMLDAYVIHSCRFIGTSMGGLLGILLASDFLKARISHLIVNDIGPDIEPDALQRIITYVGNPPSFETASEIADWFRQVYAPFGENSDYYWQTLIESSIRRTDAGKWSVHYDPNIVAQFSHQPPDLDFWQCWAKIMAPVLLLRGEGSDVLSESTASAMMSAANHAQLATIKNVAHAPTLASENEISLIRDFLR